MGFKGQKIIPAIRSMKDFEKMLKSPYTYGVLLEIHLGLLQSVMRYAEESNKKLFLHLDLIQGLGQDEAATDFICQVFKPYGLISTKGNVIIKAKQKGLTATQRVFIIDSNAMKKSIQLIKKTDPDIVEVLPGVIPKIVAQVKEATKKTIFAGGLIETAEEAEKALAAGASAITTSNSELWERFSK